MAALLSCGMESSDRIAEHTDDCRRMKIEVAAPDVNQSDVEFTVVGDKLAFGLGAIKGVGESAMEALVAERNENGPFKDIFDLCERVDPKQLTKSYVEILVKAGALDSFGPNRAQHMLVLDRAMQAAAAAARDKAAGQMSLFGEPEPSAEDEAGGEEDVSLPPADDWTHGQKLAGEKEVLGFYLTSHPLTEFADQLEGLVGQTMQDVRELDDGATVRVGGMISSIKKAQTKNVSRNGNSKYVNFDLEDATGVVRCIMWPDDFAQHGEKVLADAICIVEARIDKRGREPNLIVNKFLTLEEAERKYTKQVAVKFRRGFHTDEDMRRIRDVLSRHPGGTPVVILVDTWNEAAASEPAPNDVRVDASHETPPAPTRTAIRAFLSTATTVSANAALKEDLDDALGRGSYRYVAETTTGSQ